MELKRQQARIVLGVVALSAAVHWGVASLLLHGSADFTHAYHQLLSDSFLHGSLSLVNEPLSRHDLSVYDGRLFLYWGPIPAVVLLPVVLFFGTTWPPYFLSVCLGILGTALAYQLLSSTKSLHHLDPLRCAILALTYSLGSPAFPLAMRGNVWFVSQLFATGFLFLATSAAFHRPTAPRSAFAAGGYFGLACLSRISLVGAAPALLGWIFGRFGAPPANPAKPRITLVAFASSGLLSALIWASYNYLRFGTPLETGLTFHQPASLFHEALSQHGMFSLHHLPRNLFYQFLAHPFLFNDDPYLGGSLFLLTPLYLGCFWAFLDRSMRSFALSLLFAIVAAGMPSLLVFGTGWAQVGPRYTLDYAPFLLLLTAIGIRRWPLWLVAFLGLASITQYIHATLVLS